MLKVCDLSSNNTSAVRNNAINSNDGVIVKATEGTDYTNPYFKTDIENARKKNKLIGAYHYARAEKNSAKAEAQHFIDVVRPYLGKGLLIALDWEGASLGVSPLWARQWLDYVWNVTGIKPLLYTSESQLSKVGAQVVPGDYGLWVAKYSSNEPNIAPWKVKALWQYTSTPYDKSNFYGTRTTWKSYAKRVNR